MRKKSKYKWYTVWTVYCILLSPLAVMTMIAYLMRVPFELLSERIEKVKWWLVNRYKPD